MEIRNYHVNDETGWLRCRVLAFLDTSYYDNVLTQKEKYENPAIELVAVENGEIIGLLDIEYEEEERTVCSRGTGLGGMIWHIAIHPDHRRNGIGKLLLEEAEYLAKEKKLNRFEAWTRDDDWVNRWYRKNGFVNVRSYLHVYLEDEIQGKIKSEVPDLFPVHVFAHYVGEDTDTIRECFSRVHECVCYEKMLE
ncbi:GNAT family N-acetyltransferase [Oceanobacillus bengalensis]|uniref:N-acetyltransferase n=1 Tax=Oceanobacillus bengalensis TaxID=1435466 RepID=A0A494YZA5_9BACI|nr:GNAT family N-acetyltransferase [Oceanobacillus bengalensis]RKQ15566.1 N-acetyltransferase [Oceanobacillus bengalensis]